MISHGWANVIIMNSVSSFQMSLIVEIAKLPTVVDVNGAVMETVALSAMMGIGTCLVIALQNLGDFLLLIRLAIHK